MDSDDPRFLFDAGAMSRAQIAAVGVTVALSALDGYDVLSVTFAAPAVAEAWGIGKAALGGLLSAGLVGMALGSFVLAPLADIVGRRRLVLTSLIVMATGMFLSAFAPTLSYLVMCRVLTGLGIGGMVAVINPLAAEFANRRHRPLALALMAMGYPIGGLIGGLGSAVLLRLYGWQAVFLAGAVVAAMLVPIISFYLPEPLAFLLARQRDDELVRVNALLQRCGKPSVRALPPPPVKGSAGYAAIFVRQQVATTICVTIANLLFVMAVYYLLSWQPQIVAEAGFGASKASAVAAVGNLFGVAGGVTLGWLARRIRLNRLTAGTMFGLGIAAIGFGFTPASLPLFFIASAFCGFFLYGGIAGLYATFAISFPAEGRASGTGFVIGVGRVASAVAPLLAGWLFASGLGHGAVSAVFGGCAILAGVALLSGKSVDRS